MDIYIPQWLADKVRQKYGSLDEYARSHWDSNIRFKTGWEESQAYEVQERVNEKLSREWKRA